MTLHQSSSQQASSSPCPTGRADGDPAPLAIAQDGDPVRADGCPAPRRVIRLPIEQLSEREAMERYLIERIASSRIDVAFAQLALGIGVGAVIGIIARAIFAALAAHL